MATRPRYTPAELERYFERICLPTSKRIADVSSLASPAAQLAFLTLLCRHQACKVPWENLTQHYSWHRIVDTRPAPLFRKIVPHAGRGGYCMEANSFFHTVLLSLGYRVYLAGSRIYRPATETYGGLTHCVNIVVLDDGIKYMVDFGFGSQGPTQPIPLVHDAPMEQVAPAEMRLLHQAISQNVDQTQKVWIYQQRYNPEGAWKTYYNFLDVEFTPEDIVSMNFEPWQNRSTFFNHKVVAVRFTTELEVDGRGNDSSNRSRTAESGKPQAEPNGTSNDDEKDSEAPLLPGTPTAAALKAPLDGAITLNHDVIIWRRRGVKVRQLELTTDDMRVAALRQYFGIELADEDREAIRGTGAEIGAVALGAV